MKAVSVDDVLKILHKYGKYIFVTDEKKYSDMVDEITNLKTLEQEPCEDVISRQAIIEAFQMFRGYEANRTNVEWVDRIETVVKKLPSVNSQEPLTKEDYIELRDRFGDYVAFVVRDMVNGKGERWKRAE